MLAPVAAGVGMMRHAARHADNAVDAGRTLARACSFAAGTPVHTPMGLAVIEDLVYGDQLLARSETTGNLTYKRILDAYNHYHTDGLTITVGNSEGQRETIVATGEHPFYVIGQGFTRADELTVGQLIATHTQQPVEVLEVDLSPLELVAYNYTVEDYETYFVGEFGLWVHNACNDVAREAGSSALAPVGRSGQQTNFPNPNAPKTRNSPETINGRDFSGHAIDRMQERGFTPSVIENAIQNGARSAGNAQNTSVFTDSVNNLRVITNSETGRVITVIPGGR